MAADNESGSERKGTGTTLRRPEKGFDVLRKKGPEPTALEIAERKDWVVKSIPVWHPGDVILDTYEVEDVISGGMGHVYMANHKNWNVKLAIKSPNETMLENKSNFARILREANSWTELGLHPNIAYCYYVRNIEDIPHIFVEYVDGGNLRQWIEEGKCIDYRTSLDLAIQFCHGMEYAHSKGMIHRDIKPENVLMTKEGVLKITDFGLVRGVDRLQAEDQSVQGEGQRKGPSLTVVGAEMGTWGYMSPEQKENPHEVDERTDVFAFGICLYEMFCGNRPYEITYGPKQEAPDPVALSSDKNFPKNLVEVLKRCIQWDTSDRYRSFEDIRQKLSHIYKDLYGEESPYAELEIVDFEADGLNNMGVSYFDLDRKENAISCWKKALEINQMHLEATYNLSLTQWRDGEMDDMEVLRRLDNCGHNPTADIEKLAELKSFIHAERLDFDKARDVLKDFSGRYEDFFSGKDIDEIRSIRTLEGHTAGVHSVSISPDGRFVVSGSGGILQSEDCTLRVWDFDAGRCVRTLEGHSARVNSVSITPDGRYAVSGSKDDTLRVWDFETGRCVRTMKGHAAGVNSVSITPDGRYAVSGSQDFTLRVWDFETGRCVHILEGHAGDVRSVSITPDGGFAVSAGGGAWRKSDDNTLRVWDLDTGQCVLTMEGHTFWVNSVTITPDSRYAISGSHDNTVRLWDLEAGQCVRTMKGHTKSVNTVTITPDGRYAVSGSDDTTLRVWYLETGRCIRTLEGHTTAVNSVSTTPDGRYAVSVEGSTYNSKENTLRVWKIYFEKAYQAELMVSLPKGFKARKEEDDAFSHAIERAEALYRAGNYRNSFSILYEEWKDTEFSDNTSIKKLYSDLMKKGRKKGLHFSFQKAVLKGHSSSVNSVSITPDGRYAVSGSADKTLRVWDLETGRCVRILEGHSNAVNSITIIPNGRYAVSGSYDTTVRLWDFETGGGVRTRKGHAAGVNSVSITPDGRYAVSGSGGLGQLEDTTLRVWDLETGRCVRTMEGYTGDVNSVSIMPDGRCAVSGNFDTTLRVWDLENGQCVRTLEGHPGDVRSVSITPDGGFAVSAGGHAFKSKDDTLRVWELANGQCVHTLEGHNNWVNSVTISPDGRCAVSGSHDATVRVWNLETGQFICTLEGHNNWVNSVSITPDGRYVVTGSHDATVRVWELIWDLEFPDPVDWDEGVRPYLEIFLTLRNGKWTEEDYQELISGLAEKRGYGWVRPEGIRKELEKMSENWGSGEQSLILK